MSEPIIVTEGDLQKEVVVEDGQCFYSGIDGLEAARQIVGEAANKSTIVGSGKTPSNCLRIKLPVGYVDKDTANGNHYESKEMNRALESVKEAMEQGLVHGAHGEHPKGRADVRPDEISHLVTKAWVDPKTKYLWNEWLVVPTVKGGGQDLMKLFLAGASVGTSIRGTAVREERKYMRHYTYKGTDTVAVPSTGMRPGLKREESLRATIQVESLESVGEEFTVLEGMVEDMAKSKLAQELATVSESLKTIGEGKAGASDLIRLGSQIGSLEERVLAMESESEKKDTELTTLKTQLTELGKIKTALESERNVKAEESKTFQNAVSELQSQVESLEGEVAKKQAKLTTSITAIEELRTKLNANPKKPEGEPTVEELQSYGARCEEIIEAARDYALFLEDGVTTVKEHALKLESVIEHLRDSNGLDIEGLLPMVEALRDAAKKAATVTPKAATVQMDNYIKHVVAKTPQLKVFEEELRACKTVAQVESRQAKYLDLLGKNAAQTTVESLQDPKVKAQGIERYIPKMR